jgi:hypothetical protein
MPNELLLTVHGVGYPASWQSRVRVVLSPFFEYRPIEYSQYQAPAISAVVKVLVELMRILSRRSVCGISLTNLSLLAGPSRVASGMAQFIFEVGQLPPQLDEFLFLVLDCLPMSVYIVAGDVFPHRLLRVRIVN